MAMITSKEQRTYKIAILVAMSCVLQISESVIPHPIPGLRLGLANMLVLVALVSLGFRAALEIAVFRTILSSFIMGTFMSPTFILSFSGAFTSTLAMGLFFRLSCYHNRYGFSIIGISIIGAFTHNMVQLCLAYVLLVRHGGIFVFFPWLCIGAIVMGCVTGVVAGSVCRRLAEPRDHDVKDETIQEDFSSPVSNHYLPGNSFLHQLPAVMKISAIFVLALAVLLITNFLFYLGIFIFLAVIVLFSKTSFSFLFSRLKKYAFLILIAFSLPLFFNSGTSILYDTAIFTLTHEGLNRGSLYAFRIFFLISASALLIRTTSPEDMTRGLAKLLSPMKYLGISEKKVVMILSLSWTAIPVIWEAARVAIREADLTKPRNLRNLIPLLSNLISGLYLKSEPENRLWESAYIKQEKVLACQNKTKGV